MTGIGSAFVASRLFRQSSDIDLVVEGLPASPPGNRLEALKGDLQGYHSIRVNDQWRLVFRWSEGAAHDVRLTDYHR